jgi:acetyl esterase/lipase
MQTIACRPSIALPTRGSGGQSGPAMKLPLLARRILAVLATLVLALALLVLGLWIYFTPTHSRQDGIQYGTRNGTPLTLDVLRPKNPNGLGVAFMVSGGWKSKGPGETPGWMYAPVLRRGYTVFAISHVSQPKSSVQEIFEDVQRGIRFVRHNASTYGVDPDQIGVIGGSAGGHLSLMLATRGGPGPVNAPDPIDRASSAVQAVAIFYPVTDLIDLGTSTENLHDGGPPKSFTKAFGPTVTNLVAWTNIGRALSPLYHVHTTQPPVLIYHGTADTLTPPEQSERFQKASRALGRTVEIVYHPGGKHGWLTLPLDVRHLAAWFDAHLKAKPSSNPR